jgi:hypothetical protein
MRNLKAHTLFIHAHTRPLAPTHIGLIAFQFRNLKHTQIQRARERERERTWWRSRLSWRLDFFSLAETTLVWETVLFWRPVEVEESMGGGGRRNSFFTRAMALATSSSGFGWEPFEWLRRELLRVHDELRRRHFHGGVTLLSVAVCESNRSCVTLFCALGRRIKMRNLVGFLDFKRRCKEAKNKNRCQKWDLNPRPLTRTRTWVWRLRPLGHPDC